MNANQDPKNRPDDASRRQHEDRDDGAAPRDPGDIADEANRDDAAIPLPYRDEDEC